MTTHPELGRSPIPEARSSSQGKSGSARPFFPSPSSILHLPLPFSERRLLLMGLDLLAVNGALLLALALRPEHSLDWALLLQRPLWFLLLSALWLPLAHAFDAYDLRAAGRFRTAAPAVLKAGAITCALYLLIPYLPPALPTSRLSLFTYFLLAFALLLAGRGLYTLVLAQPLFHRRALIIGAGWAGRTIAQALADHGDGTYQIVGFVDDDPAKLGRGGDKETRRQGEGLPFSPSPCLVLGDRHALKDLIAQHHISALVLAITHDVNGELLQILMDCLEQGVEIIPMAVLYEQLTGRVPVEHVGGNWYVAMPIHHPGTGALYPLLKRLLDIVSASLGLFFLLLFLPLIALAIYPDSPGPIFYTQERVGKKQYDLYYIKHQSLWLDLVILLKTIVDTLTLRGR